MCYNSSPYETCFSMPNNNVIKQELITYKVENNMLRKIITTRTFTKNDYTDSQSIETLCAVDNNK